MKTHFTKSITTTFGVIAILLLTITLNAQTKSQKEILNKTNAIINKQKRQLVYLYASNGGIMGYYNDGTVVGCPRCEFTKSTLVDMAKQKPMGKWNLKKPDDFVSYEEDNGWVLINYQWKLKPE
jgi:hypothetical protein